eukprot:Skav218642  [mRNA]  locus=scaffold365:346507:347030:- [translate_table: standard]
MDTWPCTVLADSGKELAAGKFSSKQVTLGSKTVKRWSTDMLERGQARFSLTEDGPVRRWLVEVDGS